VYKSYSQTDRDSQSPEGQGDRRLAVRQALLGGAEVFLAFALRRYRALVAAAGTCSRRQQLQLLFGLFFQTWDETKLKVSVMEILGEPKYAGPSQVMLMMSAFAFAVMLCASDGRRVPIIFRGGLPTRMVPVGNQRSETFHVAVERLVADFRMVLIRAFVQVAVASAIDRAGANIRKLRATEAQSFRSASTAASRVPETFQGCKLHDQHHSNGESYSTLPRTIPRMAKTMASLSFTGSSLELRKILKDTT
jgi:hypothetical protein